VEDSHLKKLPIGTMGSRKGKHEICEKQILRPAREARLTEVARKALVKVYSCRGGFEVGGV
jgi:hypothetical protein